MKRERTVIYAGTRNIYHDMVVSAKSLLYNDGADHVVFLIEDVIFPEWLPLCVSVRNVSDQTFFPHNGPNYRSMWTYMVMMRMAISKLFPDLERAITLDHDTIVRKPIDFLWNVDLHGYYFAAVEELQIRNRQHPYFNFGVLVHNMAELRDGKADEIITDLNTTHHTYCEQDAGNYACRFRIFPLPQKYNSFSFNVQQVNEDEIVIKHYASRKKPLNAYQDYQFFDRLSWERVLERKTTGTDEYSKGERL